VGVMASLDSTENLLQPGFNPLIVQPIAIHYADYGLFKILPNILQMWLENKVCYLSML